jgi:hypothetical protein
MNAEKENHSREQNRHQRSPSIGLLYAPAEAFRQNRLEMVKARHKLIDKYGETAEVLPKNSRGSAVAWLISAINRPLSEQRLQPWDAQTGENR